MRRSTYDCWLLDDLHIDTFYSEEIIPLWTSSSHANHNVTGASANIAFRFSLETKSIIFARVSIHQMINKNTNRKTAKFPLNFLTVHSNAIHSRAMAIRKISADLATQTSCRSTTRSRQLIQYSCVSMPCEPVFSSYNIQNSRAIIAEFRNIKMSRANETNLISTNSECS